MLNKGFLLVISSPSGGGKTTLCRMLLKNSKDIVYSISATTRPMRRNETNGHDYYFMTEDEFKTKKNEGYFAETAKVHDYYYGTPVKMIEDSMREGKIVLMDIDVKGAMSIMEKFSDSVTIFIKPPSMNVLRERLMKRDTDREDVIQTRLKNAEEELRVSEKFKYQIVNEDINATYERISGIIDNEIKRRNK
ncbi:TPA: guanylate kinase [candidate division WOR-3 bacterium]|jgi:guanylate kinase|uniref:Guanylate kinase n=1 Tax=candidate division WOR-3 bacterium TaxID=2052148 RepID=A0A350H9Q1_UNCW3|nr:guanylate kinase [candidate division WOR-3 bacterium]